MKMRTEEWIREIRYVSYRILVVGEIAIGLSANRVQQASYLMPSSYKRRAELGIRAIRYVNYRVAVGPLVGQGCEQSELPCLADGITQQGRRSWSFYIYRICSIVDKRICGQMLLANDIVFGRWFPQNR